MTNEYKRPFPRSSIASMPVRKLGKTPPDKSDGLIRLSHNESCYGPSPAAVAAYQSISGELNRYPDGTQYELRQALAEVHNLDVDRIICGNGSEELLGLLIRAYLGEADELLLTENHFIMCPVYGRTQGADIVLAPEDNYRVSVASILDRVSDKTRIVIIANPNTPTGTCISSREVKRLHGNLPEDVLLIIDGAYMEYVAGDDAAVCLRLVAESENIVMTRTFSKIYGLAGLRIGWACCPAHVIDTLQRIRSPFNTSSAALAAAAAAVRDIENTNSIREKNANSLRRIRAALTAVGLRVTPSVANFYLISFAGSENKNAADAAQYLESRNIMPKAVNRGNPDDVLRITVGNDSENNAVITALTEYMAKPEPHGGSNFSV